MNIQSFTISAVSKSKSNSTIYYSDVKKRIPIHFKMFRLLIISEQHFDGFCQLDDR